MSIWSILNSLLICWDSIAWTKKLHISNKSINSQYITQWCILTWGCVAMIRLGEQALSIPYPPPNNSRHRWLVTCANSPPQSHHSHQQQPQIRPLLSNWFINITYKLQFANNKCGRFSYSAVVLTQIWLGFFCSRSARLNVKITSKQTKGWRETAMICFGINRHQPTC